MRKQCCDKDGTNKGAWSKQEDEKLIEYIKAHGEGSWRSLPKAAGLQRCGKSCRLRWINYLRPDIKRGNFGQDEEDLIIKLHALLGNRWALIAGRLPGRTDNEVKNYWNSHVRKKLTKMKVNPIADKSKINATQQPHDHHQQKPRTLLSLKTKESLTPTSSSADNCKSYVKKANLESDLNLSLAIAFPNNSPDGLNVVVEELNNSIESNVVDEPEKINNGNLGSSVTLILFK